MTEEKVTIARNANSPTRNYHIKQCPSISRAKQPEKISKTKAEHMGLELCPQCEGVEQPETHDTSHIEALRNAGGL